VPVMDVEIKTPPKHVEAKIVVISGRGFNSRRLHQHGTDRTLFGQSRVALSGDLISPRRARTSTDKIFTAETQRAQRSKLKLLLCALCVSAVSSSSVRG